jgi:hypothetical protein
MESLVQHDGYWTLGGADAGRMSAARQRLLEARFYVPLAELVTFGVDQLQHHPDIAKIYSQSAGLATFLMHGLHGRYREALANYLDEVYAGRATAHTLSELTGVAYPVLDQQYREFIENGAVELH